jgi:hypothetical protein
MTQGQGSDDWIAYRRADAEWVEALAQPLGDEGLTVFYDEFDGRSGAIPGSANVNLVVISLNAGWATGWRDAMARTEELDELVRFFLSTDRYLHGWMAAIVGAAGMDKTSLARYLAHRLRDQFPAGQLFCGVGGRSSQSRVLRPLLDALGVPRSELFESPTAQIEAYRVLTAGRRMLLVLDGVRGTGAAVARSGGRRRAGAHRPACHPGGARSARRCADPHRPARPAAPRAPRAERRGALRDLTVPEQEPTAERLPAGLLRAYQALPAEDRALFRRMELLLDPEVEVGLGAALIDSSAEESEESLTGLVEAQLVEPSGAGRYRVRELARDLARERLGAEEGEQDRQAALRRALRWLAARARYQPDARIARDFWTADDTLGYTQYADAIAAFIRHDETRPPLTIGVKAPWGPARRR